MPAVAPPRVAVPNRWAPSGFDPLAQTPLPARPVNLDPHCDGPPTLRVSVRPTPPRIPVPQALVTTPAPLADLDFSCSQWSSEDGFEAPNSRRAPRVGDTIYG